MPTVNKLRLRSDLNAVCPAVSMECSVPVLSLDPMPSAHANFRDVMRYFHSVISVSFSAPQNFLRRQ